MVGGAILLGDLEGPHPEDLGELARESERLVIGAGDGGGSAVDRRLAVGEGLQWVQRECPRAPGGRAGQQVECAGAADMPYEAGSLGHLAGGSGDPRIRHAEQDRSRALACRESLVVPGPAHLDPGELRRPRE